jgi:hypothetical protein
MAEEESIAVPHACNPLTHRSLRFEWTPLRVSILSVPTTTRIIFLSTKGSSAAARAKQGRKADAVREFEATLSVDPTFQAAQEALTRIQGGVQ